MYLFKIILDNGWDVIIPIHSTSRLDAWFDVTLEAIKCANELNRQLVSITYVNNRASTSHTK